MKKFRDVLSRWERGELSTMEAGELPGMSERQFRRYRGRYEEDGVEGLVDQRLGKPSPKRVPAADARLMLELYGGAYRGWNVPNPRSTNRLGGCPCGGWFTIGTINCTASSRRLRCSAREPRRGR
jgi:hypothetical protein